MVFYILLTVHLDVILVNDQLDALFLNVFISCLYMTSLLNGPLDTHPPECFIPDDVLTFRARMLDTGNAACSAQRPNVAYT